MQLRSGSEPRRCLRRQRPPSGPEAETSVLKLLVSAKENLRLPDVIMYGAEMNACQKGRQWQRAMRLLKD